MSGLRDRVVTALVRVLAAVLLALPDRALHRAAMAAGAACYLLMPERRALARANLARVCASLAARGLGGPRVTAAAGGGPALDRMLRAAFGHWLRSYLEVLTAPRYTARYVGERLTFDDRALVDTAFDEIRAGRRTIFVAAHFGSMEVPGLFASLELGIPTVAPMETIANRPLNDWLARRRGTDAIRAVPLEGAARELRGALRRGELVALVADRDITGNGRPTALFGAPASLPIGPAVLADESGAAVYVVGVRRTAPGEYRARLIRLPEAPGRSLRQRVDAFLANEVAALELLIADAPAQWWTVLFPIWKKPAAKASTSPDDVRLAA